MSFERRFRGGSTANRTPRRHSLRGGKRSFEADTIDGRCAQIAAVSRRRGNGSKSARLATSAKPNENCRAEASCQSNSLP